MSLWNKIYRTWANSPREELDMMLQEFAADYYYDDFVTNQIDILQNAAINGDWYGVEMQALALSGYIREYDLELFLRVLEEVKWSYDI